MENARRMPRIALWMLVMVFICCLLGEKPKAEYHIKGVNATHFQAVTATILFCMVHYSSPRQYSVDSVRSAGNVPWVKYYRNAPRFPFPFPCFLKRAKLPNEKTPNYLTKARQIT